MGNSLIARARARAYQAYTRLGFGLAARYRPLLARTTFVGVTGSCGKTTAKELAAAVLTTRFKGRANPASYNAPPHLDRTILRVRPWDAFCLLELSPTKMGKLVFDHVLRMVRPQIGVMTVIGTDHIRTYRTIEVIAAEKSKLIAALPAHGTAILNFDDPHVRSMRSLCAGRVISYGLAPEAMLRAEGFDVHERAFDVTKHADAAAAVDAIEAQTGPIEILVNNAGMQRRGPIQDYAASDWDALMATNLDSVFHVGQAVARRMIPRGRGRIINICSVMSELGRPGIAPYTASKGAVKMLTKGMAIDLGPLGITVNGIGPGYFKTELNQALVDDEKFSSWLIGRTPSRRWGDVEDLAGAAVFLASDAARFVNGHILYVDGGVTASI